MAKERLWGGTTNTNNLLKNHLEIYYYRGFLKYIHICKMNLNGVTK